MGGLIVLGDKRITYWLHNNHHQEQTVPPDIVVGESACIIIIPLCKAWPSNCLWQLYVNSLQEGHLNSVLHTVLNKLLIIGSNKMSCLEHICLKVHMLTFLLIDLNPQRESLLLFNTEHCHVSPDMAINFLFSKRAACRNCHPSWLFSYRLLFRLSGSLLIVHISLCAVAPGWSVSSRRCVFFLSSSSYVMFLDNLPLSCTNKQHFQTHI